jgi:hypothetical protein
MLHVSFAEVRELSIETPPGIPHGPQNSIQKRLARPCFDARADKRRISHHRRACTKVRGPDFKEFPPREVGNPAAGSAKGLGLCQSCQGAGGDASGGARPERVNARQTAAALS